MVGELKKNAFNWEKQTGTCVCGEEEGRSNLTDFHMVALLLRLQLGDVLQSLNSGAVDTGCVCHVEKDGHCPTVALCTGAPEPHDLVASVSSSLQIKKSFNDVYEETFFRVA